jgi:hypothetical protein
MTATRRLLFAELVMFLVDSLFKKLRVQGEEFMGVNWE